MQKTSTRRQFLAAASAGAALTFTATSYGKIVGANERISIGLIGCGGPGYPPQKPRLHKHHNDHNDELTPVTDPRRGRRRRGAPPSQERYNPPAPPL
ncbi:MAG: hypothetical protein QM844_09110, partial [Planctomycetota bacterium]|nr:hypothetical protein [Planctomycetota bacterium]